MNTTGREAAASLEALMASFNRRIAELQEMVISRNVHAGSSIAEFAAVDLVVKGMEQQMQAIKIHLNEEAEALPKAKALIKMSLHQQKKLQHMLANLPPQLPGTYPVSDASSVSAGPKQSNHDASSSKLAEESMSQKEKKGRGPPPHWYITVNELDSLSSYMRGRLTLDKVNGAVDEMAQNAEANAHLLAAPRKKLGDDMLKRVLELRDISASEPVKGKHFFLETDLKGPLLKLDNTGKAILTVLRHLGRVHEARIGRHRVLILSKPR